MTRLGYTVVREAQHDDGNYGLPATHLKTSLSPLRHIRRLEVFAEISLPASRLPFEVALRFSVFFLTSPVTQSCLFEVYICAWENMCSEYCDVSHFL